MSAGRVRVAVIGCGLMGRRRAHTAASDARSAVAVVVDADRDRAASLGAACGAEADRDWRGVIERRDVQAVVVATPNGYLAKIGRAALAAGKHVLLEKPMGRNLAEAEELVEAARRGGLVLKIGFNHRYHPGLRRALASVQEGRIGRVINIRARYGHGARPGYESEWRGDPELAGGGHLVDQGVHLADLVHGVAGMPALAVAFLQTSVWPIQPLEDNAYGMFRFADGAVAQLHVSLTQWKNLFSFEVHGEDGAVIVDGLGGSYGIEKFAHIGRNHDGGPPCVREEAFSRSDQSWRLEWDDFVQAVESGRPDQGGPEDGLAAMRMIDALYRSARAGAVVDV